MRFKRNLTGNLSGSTMADAKSSSTELIPLDRQRKNVAHAALGADHPRRIRINLQLAPQPQDLNIDAAIEDILMNSRRAQEMLARKRSPWRLQKRQQQGVLTFAQRDCFFIGVYQPSATTLQLPAIEPIASSIPLAAFRDTRHLPSS